MTINVPNIATAKWIILNIQEFGYYRVNYPEDIWTALTTQLTENHTVSNLILLTFSQMQKTNYMFALSMKTHQYSYSENNGYFTKDMLIYVML